MSNIRIKTNLNKDNFVKLKLDQDFDFVEVLSLKLSQEDVYRKFSADYGVIVGRVSVNNGFGVPNAMVSVFIPIDDIDKNNPEIKGLYPYEVITDKNNEGVRYNLLPKNGDETNPCSTPIGTFPTKREILDNEVLGKIYEKYYKFTTTTNHAGDFMIFGVPLGTYTVHVDADISDMGIISQRPYDLINQGTPKSMFESPTKFKGDKNLNKLLQIKTLNAGVNVIPFWGDTDDYEIGITRLDFDLNHKVIPSAIFMGNIYGDDEKNSVNKNCRPRKKLGDICEQTTGSGSINMIRKTFDGSIESFDVDGGRLIDDTGSWAYQVPMNLDYVITDEEGNLSYSQDPNKGIATRASVRFNIGMDENGGEGRLRTRARYLVPNNPNSIDEVDYEFNENTKDSSFRDLYWNKIYTVSNFISRFQAKKKSSERAYTGIKDVDACVGTKNPFPYNRVDTNVNPIFIIICLIITIIILVIGLINATVVEIVNTLLSAWNGLMNAFCKVSNKRILKVKIFGFLGFTCKLVVDYIPCISAKCNENTFAPGCRKGSKGYEATGNVFSSDGLDKCIAFEMAKALNLFRFDFYNDWVNGSLFAFLLKYKKRRKKHNKNGVEKFCEYECSGGDFQPIDGVDANENGSPDNRCSTNYLNDSCYDGSDAQDKETSVSIKEGLVKKLDDELYYAASTHNMRFKMFATDIVNLGSVFECDWQGIPKINQLLIPTSYKLPPDTREISDEGVVQNCGQVTIEGEDSLFFSINCVGIHVNTKGCLNIRHICEMGVDLDETIFDSQGVVIQSPNCNIGNADIDDDSGKWFRDVFFGLNNSWSGNAPLIIPSTGFSTGFNLQNEGEYNFAKVTDNGKEINGQDYIDFRGYPIGNNNGFAQPKNSYYFYFGLNAGKTALEKMNEKYFTPCVVQNANENTVTVTTVNDIEATGSGSVTITFNGSNTSFDYEITGLNYFYSGHAGGNDVVTIGNLLAGTFNLKTTDASGLVLNKTFKILGPTELSGVALVTKNSTTISSDDGQITITDVFGGKGPYTYTLYKYAVPTNSGQIISGPTTLTTPLIINNVPYDITNGHTLKITDSLGTDFYIYGLKVGGTPILSVSATKTDMVCFDSRDGSISLNITGGQVPYTIQTIGPDDFSSAMMNLTNLNVGSYTSTITDGAGTVVSVTNVITSQAPEIVLTLANDNILKKQCSSTSHLITMFASFSFNAPSSVSFGYFDDDDNFVAYATVPYVNATTPLTFTVPTIDESIYVTVKFGDCYSEDIEILESQVMKPSSNLNGSITRTGPVSGDYTYNVTGTGGIGIISGTGVFTSSATTYNATITDSVGCTKNLSY